MLDLYCAEELSLLERDIRERRLAHVWQRREREVTTTSTSGIARDWLVLALRALADYLAPRTIMRDPDDYVVIGPRMARG